ncbi:MAG: hypothetical protein EHM61_14600 [Acidobacteria bacterium]|nr:MAG: hypothetical protein EHM61_14600 [Acidobacteriota bacterium]
MRKACLLCSLFVLVSQASSQPAQNRRLIVVNPSEKELVKEANRLGICPDRLKNGREAIREALEMAPEVAREMPVFLGAHLIKYESKQAQTLMSSLYEKLLDETAQSNDPQELAILQFSAVDLISALDKQNPSLAKKLESRWPQPLRPSRATQPVEEPSVQDQIHKQMKTNPEEALLQLPMAESGGADFLLRGNLLRELWEQNRPDAARQLLNESAALLPLAGSRGQSALGPFLQTALGLFPDSREALLSATAQWYAALEQMGGPESDFRSPSGKVFRVSSADFALLNQLAALRMHPEFSEQMARISPTLHSRIQSAGGVPWLFTPDTGSRNQVRRTVNEASKADLEAVLTGVSNPKDIKAALSEVCRGNDQEKREKVFSLLLRQIQSEKEPTNAASEMMSFASDCIRCLGEFPVDWYSAGKNLVRQLREAEEQDQPVPRPGAARPRFRRSFATDFEAYLFEKRARTDFAGVIGEVRAIPEKPRAFLILMQIIQGLSSS